MQITGHFHLAWKLSYLDRNGFPIIFPWQQNVEIPKCMSILKRLRKDVYLVATLQSSTHNRNISNALKTVIHTSISLVNNHLLYWFVMIFWVNKFSHSKILCWKSKFMQARVKNVIWIQFQGDYDWRNKNIIASTNIRFCINDKLTTVFQD